MKKLGWILILVLLISGCSKRLTMHNVTNEPHFKGVVVEVTDTTITVKVNEDEEVIKSSDIIVVSLDVKIKDGLSEYTVGDEVCVYYNGEIAESYPAQVLHVYAIIIVQEK